MTMTDDNQATASAEGKAQRRTLEDAATPYAAAWTATGVPASPATIDPDLWPEVAQPPSGAKAAVAGKAAGLLFKGAVKRLPLRVE